MGESLFHHEITSSYGLIYAAVHGMRRGLLKLLTQVCVPTRCFHHCSWCLHNTCVFCQRSFLFTFRRLGNASRFSTEFLLKRRKKANYKNVPGMVQNPKVVNIIQLPPCNWESMRKFSFLPATFAHQRGT